MEKVVFGSNSDKYFQIRTQLLPTKRKELLIFLRSNVDVFAWSTYKAPGVDPEFICHHLNGNLAITPRRQQPQQSFKEHAETVKEEVNKLKQTRATKENFFFFLILNG